MTRHPGIKIITLRETHSKFFRNCSGSWWVLLLWLGPHCLPREWVGMWHTIGKHSFIIHYPMVPIFPDSWVIPMSVCQRLIICIQLVSLVHFTTSCIILYQYHTSCISQTMSMTPWMMLSWLLTISKKEDCFYMIFVLYILISIWYWAYSGAMTRLSAGAKHNL